MSTISSLSTSSASPVTTGKATSLSASAVQQSSTSTGASSSTIVSLRQASTDALTYGPAGTANVGVVWESNTTDAVSSQMGANLGALTNAGRFSGLGSALLERFKTDSGDYSQSAFSGSSSAAQNQALQKVAQSGLHAAAGNRVTLDITTRSGTKVELTIGGDNNGLATDIKVTGGTLGKAEQTALAKLADGFQNAIDGLASDTPKIDFSGLLQFDTSQLSSVDFNSVLVDSDGKPQTAAFHADATKRTISVAGTGGTVNLSVDQSNPAILGSADQQSRAIGNYLKQFDSAQARGHGDQSLMTQFKDAFTQLNSNYATPLVKPASPLSDADRSLLTGLADFSGGVDQTPKSVNPLKPAEVDSFSYKASQETRITDHGRADYALTQDQQSSLAANFHLSLTGGPVALGTDKASQNYYYTQVSDTAESRLDLAYDRGGLVKAMLTQTASQNTRTLKYVMGNLESDQTTPSQSSWSKDLLGMLRSAQQYGEATQQDAEQQARALSAIGNLTLLQTDPSRIAALAAQG